MRRRRTKETRKNLVAASFNVHIASPDLRAKLLITSSIFKSDASRFFVLVQLYFSLLFPTPSHISGDLDLIDFMLLALFLQLFYFRRFRCISNSGGNKILTANGGWRGFFLLRFVRRQSDAIEIETARSEIFERRHFLLPMSEAF